MGGHGRGAAARWGFLRCLSAGECVAFGGAAHVLALGVSCASVELVPGGDPSAAVMLVEVLTIMDNMGWALPLPVQPEARPRCRLREPPRPPQAPLHFTFKN